MKRRDSSASSFRSLHRHAVNPADSGPQLKAKEPSPKNARTTRDQAFEEVMQLGEFSGAGRRRG